MTKIIWTWKTKSAASTTWEGMTTTLVWIHFVINYNLHTGSFTQYLFIGRFFYVRKRGKERFLVNLLPFFFFFCIHVKAEKSKGRQSICNIIEEKSPMSKTFSKLMSFGWYVTKPDFLKILLTLFLVKDTSQITDHFSAILFTLVIWYSGTASTN